MAVIQFSNGVKINFNGNPTPQDVEEVAQKLNLKPTAPVAQPPSDTKADQATFPATQDDSPLAVIAKTLGNIPASAYDFGKNTLEFLNPLNTLKTIQQAHDEGQSAVAEGQDPETLAENTLKGLPEAAYKTLVPQFLQHIFSGNLDKAASTIENDPIGQIAPLILVARGAASAAGKAPEFDQALKAIASPVTKPAAAVAETGANIAKGAAKFGSSQLTGLSPHTLEQVISNPAQFSKDAQATITRPALAETINAAIKDRQTALDDTGAGYSGVRTLAEPVPVSSTYLDDLITKTTGLKVVDGKLTASGSSSIRLPADVNALQTKLYNIWAPEFAKGYLTPDQFLNFRHDLSKMVYNDSGVGKSTALANLSSIMRAHVNTDLRPAVPGLEAIDRDFAPQKTQLTQLSQGLVDKDGNLTDSAINRIANATGKGKDPLLDRLEQLSPGVTGKIKILKAVEDIQNSRENKPGTYLRAGALGAGIVTLNPYLIVSAIMSLPEVAVPLMRGLGYSHEFISKTLQTLGIPDAIKAVPQKGGKAILKSAIGATSASNTQ